MADAYDINKNVRRLIRTVLGITDENAVRPANQKAPTGSIDQQFATVLITALNTEGWDVISNKDEAGPSTNVKEVVQGVRHVMASIQFFRGDAYTKVARLPALLRTTTALELMRTLGIGLIRTGSPRNLTTLVDTNFEERGQIDIEFYIIAREVISLPTYGEFPVSVDLAIEKPDGSFYPPQSFEVIAP